MKFSVITITYNRAHLITETIRSVLNQTYTDFEHIIVDDGSTDNTMEVINTFSDNRLKYFRCSKSGNLSKLRNYGIAKSTGSIISILDSDDIWVSEKLEIISKILANDPKINVVIHNVQYFSNLNQIGNNYYNYARDFNKNICEDVLFFKILPFPAISFKKEILGDSIYLNPFFKEALQDFLIRISINHKVYYINKALTKIRKHNQNTHKTINYLPYYTNYYFSVGRLLFINKIKISSFIKGVFLNTKRLLKHILSTN